MYGQEGLAEARVSDDAKKRRCRALGVIAATRITRNTSFIVLAVFGVAVAATAGMAAGQYLSDPKRSVRRAMVIGAAILAGSVSP